MSKNTEQKHREIRKGSLRKLGKKLMPVTRPLSFASCWGFLELMVFHELDSQRQTSNTPDTLQRLSKQRTSQPRAVTTQRPTISMSSCLFQLSLVLWPPEYWANFLTWYRSSPEFCLPSHMSIDLALKVANSFMPHWWRQGGFSSLSGHYYEKTSDSIWNRPWALKESALTSYLNISYYTVLF